MKLPYVSKGGAMGSLFQETLDLNKKEDNTLSEMRQERIQAAQEGRPAKKAPVINTNYVPVDKNGNPTDDPKQVVDVLPASMLRQRGKL